MTKTSSWWYDGLPPTVDSEINKVLSQIESETTTDDTEVSPSPGQENQQDNQQDNQQTSGLSDMGITATDNDGDGVWESEYGELYKLENDKWKVSFDNGNTWEEL